MATPRAFIPKGLGWQPDLPDPRDYSLCDPLVSEMISLDDVPFLPDQVDLRQDDDGIYFTAPKDQGHVNASSVFSLLSIIEFGERKALGKSFDASARFVYQMAKRISGVTGNANVGLRQTLKAIKRYGFPPERLCPYELQYVDEGLVDVSLLGYQNETQQLIFFRPRLESASIDVAATDPVMWLKSMVAIGLPFAFGFAVPSSMGDDGEIPFRPTYDAYHGGQAVVAVGYDDLHLPGKQGSFLVRSSWGSEWGDDGYGWVPYSLFTHGQAADVWCVISKPWVESGVFVQHLSSRERVE